MSLAVRLSRQLITSKLVDWLGYMHVIAIDRAGKLSLLFLVY